MTWWVSPWNQWLLSETLTVSRTHSLTVSWAPHPTVSTISISGSLHCNGSCAPWQCPIIASQVVCLPFRECAHQSPAVVNPTQSFLMLVSFKCDTSPSCGLCSIPLCQQCRMGSVTDWPLCWQRHTSRKKKMTVHWNAHVGVHQSRAENRVAAFIARQRKANTVGRQKKKKKKMSSRKILAKVLKTANELTVANSSSASGHSLVGVHQGHPHPPREEPRPPEVGGPSWGRLQVPQVGGSGSDVGSEEEEQQHDLWETQSCHEVIGCAKLMIWKLFGYFVILSSRYSNYGPCRKSV